MGDTSEEITVWGNGFDSAAFGGDTRGNDRDFNPVTSREFGNWYKNFVKNSPSPVRTLNQLWADIVAWWKKNVHFSISPSGWELAIAGLSYKFQKSATGKGLKKSGDLDVSSLAGILLVFALGLVLVLAVIR